MKSRKLLVFFALITGLAAAAGVFVYVKTLQTRLEREAQKAKVLVATANLSKDSLLEDLATGGMTEQKEIPIRYVAEGAIKSFARLDKGILTQNVGKGQQLTSGMFLSAKKAGLVSDIPKGMRAIAVKVDKVTGVSDQVKSGNRVDLIAYFKEDSKGDEVAKTVLQNVLIIKDSLDGNNKSSKGLLSSASDNNSRMQDRTVILATSLKNAEKIVFAQENGRLWLVLRPDKKEAKVNTAGQNIDVIMR